MAGGRDKEGGANTEATALVALFLVGLLLWLLWTFVRPAIVLPAFALDYVSITVIEALRGLGDTGRHVKDVILSFFDGRRDPAKDITFTDFLYIRSTVGSQTRLVIAGIVAFLAGVVLFKMKGDGFKRVFSLAGGKNKGPSFALYQAGHWRTATWSANFEPDGRDKELLPAATPLEWLRDNGVEYEDSMLDRDACEAAFAKQLGKRWHGLARADLHVQAVAVMCALHLLRRKEALPEREAVNIAWACGQDGTQAMKSLVDRYKGDTKVNKVIETICSKHAYANTALHALLDRARAAGGVLNDADFGYIKKIDRPFWYTLNNVGRRRFHTEGAGAVCHYFAERTMGSPLPEPHLEQAIDGIEDYLSDQGVMSLTQFFEETQEF